MYVRIWAPSAWTVASLLAAFSAVDYAAAQSSPKAEPLPKVTVEQSAVPAPAKPTKKKTASNAKLPGRAPAAPPTTASAQTSGTNAIPNGVPADRSGSLVSPDTSEARAEIDRTPGGVELVPDTAYKASTPSATIKDALDYVPGVFAQPKWGDDTRLSIRGSGLSRNFHLRGLELYMDGIPINTADGFGDFQEIDPTAYRYIEVYKGANALRFGANSLGGAINFVMPTGYDASLFGARVDLGSFGFHKLAVSSGGVAGPVDYFITGTAQEIGGFRDHSWGESARGAFDVGYRLSENVETRVYLNANWVRQRIPGEVTKQSALTSPQTADPLHVTNDWQRNIDTLRIADKTALRLGPGTLLEVGAFNVDRHLMHPIFLWLDNTYDDYGGFTRLSDARLVGGHKNRLIAGANLHNGDTDARM
jgi:iron complex outermembrane receptor protein